MSSFLIVWICSCGNIASILEFDGSLNRTQKDFNGALQIIVNTIGLTCLAAVPDDKRVVPPRITTPYFL